MPDSPFAAYARKHGFENVTKLPGAIGKYLSSKPKRVAPNSPGLEALAKFMGVPLAELQPFAKAPPMGEKWVRKIRGQIENGTLPRGGPSTNKRYRRKRAKRPTGVQGPASYAARNPFTKLVLSKGTTLTQLAETIGAKQSALWRVSMGGMAPNHPLIARIAHEIKVPVSQLAAMQRARPITGAFLTRAEKQFAIGHNGHESHDPNPGKAIVLASTEHGPGAKPANGHSAANSNGKGTYNRLKKLDLARRQSARVLVATVNYHVMKGDTLSPPLPLHDLHFILEDYLREKGIKENVLVDPKFSQLFDR